MPEACSFEHQIHLSFYRLLCTRQLRTIVLSANTGTLAKDSSSCDKNYCKSASTVYFSKFSPGLVLARGLVNYSGLVV
jgi:hypothetical protein